MKNSSNQIIVSDLFCLPVKQKVWGAFYNLSALILLMPFNEKVRGDPLKNAFFFFFLISKIWKLIYSKIFIREWPGLF